MPSARFSTSQLWLCLTANAGWISTYLHNHEPVVQQPQKTRNRPHKKKTEHENADLCVPFFLNSRCCIPTRFCSPRPSHHTLTLATTHTPPRHQQLKPGPSLASDDPSFLYETDSFCSAGNPPLPKNTITPPITLLTPPWPAATREQASRCSWARSTPCCSVHLP